MTNGNQKGKRGERDACDSIEQALSLIPGSLRRSQQYSGKGDSSADIVGLDGVHFEVKRTEKFKMYDALEQADTDAKDGNVPVVVTRRNHESWVVVVRLENLKALIQQLSKVGSTNEQRKICRTPFRDKVLPTQPSQ